jgi:predicted 3-demethylubiquinone-9 3-methyltransferase (glyoxalase superfamily)
MRMSSYCITQMHNQLQFFCLQSQVNNQQCHNYSINLPVRVRDKYEVFGIHLLNDDYGDKMVILRERFLRDAEKITMEVLVEWLRGRGVGVSWQSLITTLRDSELFLMADQLQTALEQLLHHNKSKKGKLA